MSVDISQLTARLDPERRDAVKTQYEERATNATATFLLCFFLGSAGAHRFYLREWRVAFAHLALFALGAASLIAGLFQTLPLTTGLTAHPVGAALDVVGALLLLVALIWEIIDLGRIDHQVYQRNLLLAEGIIAGTLLADQSVIEGARQKLDALTQKAHEQVHAGAAPAATATAAATAAAGAGVITASEVADARALAEETGGFSAISYTEVSKFDVSEDPDQTRQASADAMREGDWVESSTVTEQEPTATPDATPMTLTETETRTHTEDGPRVTDTYEVDRTAHPSMGEIAGLGAAGLGAGVVEATHGAGFDEPTQPDAASVAPEAEARATSEAPVTQVYTTEPYTSEAPAAEPTTEPYTAPAAEPYTAEPYAATTPAYGAYADDQYGFDDDDVGDVTDASMPAIVVPTSDIAVGNSSPAFVRLPEEQEPTPEAYTLDAPETADAPLYLIPEEPTTDVYPYAPEPMDAPAYDAPAYDVPASVEPPAEAYVPPVASVFSAPTPAPQAPIPSWDQPPSVYPPAEPVAEPQPIRDDTLAEVAGVTGLAGMGALTGEELVHEYAPEPTPEPVAAEPIAAPTPEPLPEPAAAAEPVAPEPPKMKKIRVRRKVVVDGQVVAEEVVEREVPADMDTAEAAAQIQAELGHLTPEQIAQRAHLSPDEEVELHQRTEGPSAEQ